MGASEARQSEVDSLASHLRPYTEREKKLLAMKYTPEQMKAIEEGEKAIDPTDMMTQGRFRTDPMRIDYIDDFATQRPGLDRIKAGAHAEDAPLVEGMQPLVDAMGGPRPKQSKSGKQDQEEEEDPRLLRLSQQTGLSKEAIRKIRVKNLVSHRVVNQTRMGKIQSLYFLTIAGNQDGMLGIGEGKAAEDEDGRRQAMMNAIRNMKPIPRYEERTIFGEVEGKVGASVVKLSSRPPGELYSLHTLPTMLMCDRLRQPLPTSHLRARPRCWYLRPCCSNTSLTQQNERRQGRLPSSHQPASTRRDCPCQRKKDGGCSGRVLWRACTLVR